MMGEAVLSQLGALRLFGSSARHENDCRSDTDILVVGGEWNEDLEKSIKGIMPLLPPDSISISWYSKSKIKDLYRQGDLFSWHIHLESKKIFECVDYIDRLGTPNEYRDASETFKIFRVLLDSVEDSLVENDTSLVYEAGLIYVASRNIAMALSWYGPNGLNFSRTAAIALGASVDIPFPLDINEYEVLVNCRLRVQRGREAVVPSREWLLETCRATKGWADALWNKLFTER